MDIVDYSMPVALICLFPSLRFQSLFFFPAQRRARGECEKGKKAEASPFGWRCDRVEACTYCTVQFLGESSLRLRDKHPSSQWKRSGCVCGVAYLITSVPALMEQVRSHYRPVLSILHEQLRPVSLAALLLCPLLLCLRQARPSQSTYLDLFASGCGLSPDTQYERYLFAHRSRTR